MRTSLIAAALLLSASLMELRTFPGISDADADRIIAGRPYLGKVHLATRNVCEELKRLGRCEAEVKFKDSF